MPLIGNGETMPVNDPTKTLDELLNGHTIVMLMTMIGDAHSSRPLTVAEVADGRLSFLVDRTTEWGVAVQQGRAVVHVTVADERSNTYLALNGSASISTDGAELDRLWNPAAGAFFDGKDDPGVAVLHFDVSDGEYWDGPSGRLGSVLGLVRAALTDDPGRAGDRGAVDVD